MKLTWINKLLYYILPVAPFLILHSLFDGDLISILETFKLCYT